MGSELDEFEFHKVQGELVHVTDDDKAVFFKTLKSTNTVEGLEDAVAVCGLQLEKFSDILCTYLSVIDQKLNNLRGSKQLSDDVYGDTVNGVLLNGHEFIQKFLYCNTVSDVKKMSPDNKLPKASCYWWSLMPMREA